jgi:hypothetical protein
MPKYMVGVREVHIAHWSVEAANEQEAVELVEAQRGQEQFTEFSHTLDPEYWTVEQDDDTP